MPIICLEGASGIGKTTASKFMADEYGYIRIPEVNELFERPPNEAEDWYFQMQVNRWMLAKDASAAGNVAILDGDHLQPIWYNWIFEDLGFQSMSEVLAFYSKAFSNRRVGFADAYVVLTLETSDLRLRKEGDKTRNRSNFETHLRLIEPQIEYFQYLKSSGLNGISFVQSSTTNEVAKLCRSVAEKAQANNHNISFDIVEKFITSTITNI